MTYKEQHPKLPTKTHFSTFTEKEDFTFYISNQDQERSYTSQLKSQLAF